MFFVQNLYFFQLLNGVVILYLIKLSMYVQTVFKIEYSLLSTIKHNLRIYILLAELRPDFMMIAPKMYKVQLR